MSIVSNKKTRRSEEKNLEVKFFREKQHFYKTPRPTRLEL